IARPQSRGEKQLVAYVVPANPVCFSANALKNYLAEHLPPYMVPAHIVALERLPLTANAKVDRSALPAPPTTTVRADYAAPLTELQEKLEAIWRRILHCPVGLDDKFFDVGGSSLQLLEVHAEVSKLLGRQLPVLELFEHATIRSLADRL